MTFRVKKTVEVKRVGVSLVAAFHKANPSLVWRFDLNHNHSFSLALQGAEGDWQLGLTLPSGEFQTVAHFAERADAELAFTETEKVLAKGMPTVLSVIVKIVVALIVLYTGFVIFGFLIQNNIIPKRHSYSPTANAPANRLEAKPGVPFPADEFLTPPSQ